MSLRIIFHGDQLWARRAGAQASCLLDAGVPAGTLLWTERLATPDGAGVEAMETAAMTPPAGIEAVPLRAFFDLATPADYATASHAFELLHWRRSHRFCGQCGQPLARRAQGVTAFYSVIAGFVEAAETLEHAAEREIAEEVGLRVKNLRYFGSQPWPYPNNLMCAFTAEYASGEIQVDGKEIGAAGWFTPENLPPIPPAVSISRRLIDAWLEEPVA